ncbi:MAG: hypothetical protein H6744_05230 [Deltaproteobacteria bacterium]|nr:hypothetical protein [Deltaproteobacteria bacterium]MCB9786080.1 hypothetical protein [Deltaproteobacteria bacterium]
MKHLAIPGLLAATLLAAGGCDGGEGDCTRPTLVPQVERLNLGDLRARAAGEPADPANVEAVPFEWVLLLQSKCTEPVVISEVCVVGDAHNGKAGDPAFTLEGPVPATVPFRSEAALRVTYDHPDPNTLDADEDGEPDPDSVAIVIQSNAVNAPTLVVPICARIIGEGEPAAVPCVSPVTVGSGMRVESLCR